PKPLHSVAFEQFTTATPGPREFAWTVILIVFAILLALGGIDILEYYRRAAGEPKCSSQGSTSCSSRPTKAQSRGETPFGANETPCGGIRKWPSQEPQGRACGAMAIEASKSPSEPDKAPSFDTEEFARNVARVVEQAGKAMAAYLKPREEGRV